MLSCFGNSKNLQPDVNVPKARMCAFLFLIKSSWPLLMQCYWVIAKQEQQQVSSNGRPTKWVGGVFTRCAALVTNMENDNLSLKIPQSILHPAEAGVWPETIYHYIIINPHNNSLLLLEIYIVLQTVFWKQTFSKAHTVYGSVIQTVNLSWHLCVKWADCAIKCVVNCTVVYRVYCKSIKITILTSFRNFRTMPLLMQTLGIHILSNEGPQG